MNNSETSSNNDSDNDIKYEYEYEYESNQSNQSNIHEQNNHYRTPTLSYMPKSQGNSGKRSSNRSRGRGNRKPALNISNWYDS